MSDVVSQDFTLGPHIIPDDNYGVLRYVLRAEVPLDTSAVEFGVGAGGSTRLIARYMPVTGFDSERGLPEAWREGYPKGSLTFTAPVIRNFTLVSGWFADTLPGFDWDTVMPLGLVHFDADLYSSTATALEHVMPHVGPGCVIVFDEYHGYVGCQLHEMLAFKEYAGAHDISWDVIGHGEQQWAIRLK